MADSLLILSEAEQLEALSPAVMCAYAAGELAWGEMRERLMVTNFDLVLRRLHEERLQLPRAPADRPTRARGWLREALDQLTASSRWGEAHPHPG